MVMDLLEKYKEQYPEALREQKWKVPHEYGFLIRLLMKMSRGKIRDKNRQTLYYLF